VLSTFSRACSAINPCPAKLIYISLLGTITYRANPLIQVCHHSSDGSQHTSLW